MSGNTDDVDWLDLGPDPDEGKPPSDPRRRYLWYGGAAALVVAVLLTRTQHGTGRAAAPSRSAAAGASAGPVSSASGSGTASDTAGSAVSPGESPASSGTFVDPTAVLAPMPNVPVRVIGTGHRLLDVPAGWDLFALGESSVVRIQLAAGRVTVTALPAVATDPSTAFLVGADRAIVRPMGGTAASVVRDGKPAESLAPSLEQGPQLLPGPDSRHMWAEEAGGLSLLTLDGKPTGTTIEVPVSGSVMGSDGTGYAVLTSMIGGAYYARPGSVHRITSGVLVAAGPTRWLVNECDDSLRCALIAIDRATGARHTMNSVPDSWYDQSLDAMSPDGRTVAVPRPDGENGSAGIDLLDLASGLRHPVDVTRAPLDQPHGSQLVWSPDSRWLFVVDAGRRVVVVNRATGKATPLRTALPPVFQLAFRHRDG